MKDLRKFKCHSQNVPFASPEADMVAKSFINGVIPVGTIVPPWRAGIPLPPFWLVVAPGAPVATATQRLNLLAGLVGGLQAFNQNPVTDAKDQTYRLYTRVYVKYDCCPSDNHFTLVSVNQDKDGGKEILFVRGTINIQVSNARTSDNCYLFEWKGWGRPNRIVEPGMQWVATRTSVNIWHEVRVELCCENGNGVYRVKRYINSAFPSHRLWINGGAPLVNIVQTTFGDLWNPLPGNPAFVDE